MQDRVLGMSKALALAGNEHTIGDVVGEILRGEAQSWERDGAWIVTRVVDMPRVRSLHFWLASGEKAACVKLAREIIEWGRGIGCTRATLFGREGWTRVLQNEGWRPSELVVLEREI